MTNKFSFIWSHHLVSLRIGLLKKLFTNVDAHFQNICIVFELQIVQNRDDDGRKQHDFHFIFAENIEYAPVRRTGVVAP